MTPLSSDSSTKHGNPKRFPAQRANRATPEFIITCSNEICGMKFVIYAAFEGISAEFASLIPQDSATFCPYCGVCQCEG